MSTARVGKRKEITMRNEQIVFDIEKELAALAREIVFVDEYKNISEIGVTWIVERLADLERKLEKFRKGEE